MEENNNLEMLVQGLTIIKDEFIRNKEELKVSKRKDVVAVELKSILDNNSDFNSLKTAIQEYIDDLYKM